MKHEPSPRRVRVYFAGVPIADTYRAHLVWEVPYYPAYYLPLADVTALTPSDRVRPPDPRGTPRCYDVRVGDRVAHGAAWSYPDSEELRELVRIEWTAMDGWFEEDEEVFAHPRDPYKRMDIVRGSRHVIVSYRGVRLAESRCPTLVFETPLPMRFYLPKTDVRMDLLVPLARTSTCAYKGHARYWGHADLEDVAWSYPTPFPEAAKIAGLVAFYNETLDIDVDGARLPKPVTPFSR